MLDQWVVQAFQAYARALSRAKLNTKGSEIQMLAYAEEIYQESTKAKSKQKIQAGDAELQKSQSANHKSSIRLKETSKLQQELPNPVGLDTEAGDLQGLHKDAK